MQLDRAKRADVSRRRALFRPPKVTSQHGKPFGQKKKKKKKLSCGHLHGVVCVIDEGDWPIARHGSQTGMSIGFLVPISCSHELMKF